MQGSHSVADDIYALTGDITENWLFGFLGALWAHSIFYPMALYYVMWFMVAWLSIYIRDPIEVNLHYHSTMVVSLILGACQGLIFARLIGTPKFIDSDGIKKPGHTILVLGVVTLTTGLWFLFPVIPALPFYNNFNIPLAYFPDATNITSPENITLIVALTAIVLALMALTLAVCEMRKSDDGISAIKYMVLFYFWFVNTSGNIRRSLPLCILGLVLAYIAMYFWTLCVWKRRDVVFQRDGSQRRRHIQVFFFAVFVQQLVVFALTNQVQGCFQRENRADCSANEGIFTVFFFVSFVSLLSILVMALLFMAKKQAFNTTLNTVIKF